ncbi:MAG: hypothetical protein H7839_24000 [Magnetococcus sp. YQC-5]
MEIVSALWLKRHADQATPPSQQEMIAKLYPGESYKVVAEMLEKHKDPALFAYQPFVEMSVRETHNKFINIFPPGYRSSVKMPWPPSSDPKINDSVFVFGGSTTFGFGVADDQTIPYYLGKELGRPTYNLGVPTYYSTIERIAFFNLVTQGILPRIAVFIDGLNDFIFYEVPDKSNVSRRLATAFGLDWLYLLKKVFAYTHTVQLVLSMSGSDVQDFLNQRIASKQEIEKTVARLIMNREIIQAFCKEKEILCFFVDQPVPTVDYDNAKRLVPPAVHFMGAENCVYGYTLLREQYRQHPSNNHLDLSRITVQEPVYIDSFHYSKKMNQYLAEIIATYILGRR